MFVIKENLRPQAGSSGRPEVTNVFRIVAPGGCIGHILRGSEALGGPASNQAGALGACIFKEPQTSGRELREAGSDECLEDGGSGRLHVLYFTKFGGPGWSGLYPVVYFRL